MVHLAVANAPQAEGPLADFPWLSFPSQWNLLKQKRNEESKLMWADKKKVLRKVDCEHGGYKAM